MPATPPTELVTLFDVFHVDPDYSAAWEVAPMLIGVVIVAVTVWVQSGQSRLLTLAAAVAGAFMWITVGTTVLLAVGRTLETCQEWARTGQFRVVEGPVHVLGPTWYGSRDAKVPAFRVDRFDILAGSEWTMCGFAYDGAPDSPIREGRFVRISFHDKAVLRVQAEP
jgi:hypothetical protein